MNKTKTPNKHKQLLTPLPYRWLSAIIAVGALVLLWGSVLTHHTPKHSVAMMLLITSGLSSFHAFGWRPKHHWEKWLLSPVGSLLLILFTLWLFLR